MIKIAAVSYIASSLNEFKNMLNSLDMVVTVMIICAAALAFVVLYNLTNINIAERVREIATFKVLGFYNRENLIVHLQREHNSDYSRNFRRSVSRKPFDRFHHSDG